MRRRSGKHGTAGASLFILDLDQLEAEFWNRPAEQVHADLQSPLNWPIAGVVAADKEGRLSPKQKAELFRAFTPLPLPDNERRRRKGCESPSAGACVHPHGHYDRSSPSSAD